MVKYVIDQEAADALTTWLLEGENMRYAKDCPNFFPRVTMEVETKPCPVSIRVEKNSDGSTLRVKATQLSFMEDIKFMIKNVLDEPMKSFARENLKRMKGEPDFRKQTTSEYSFRVRTAERNGKLGFELKMTKFPSLKEYYGFDPRKAFRVSFPQAQKLSLEAREIAYADFQKNATFDMRRHFESDAEYFGKVFLAANAFMYYANATPQEERYIAATGSNDGNDKVIVFKTLSESKELYAVRANTEKSKSGDVVPVRGYLKRLDSSKGFYKEDKVVWVDAFLRGLEPEYYAEKRRSKRYEKKADARTEDPKTWVTHVGAPAGSQK